MAKIRFARSRLRAVGINSRRAAQKNRIISRGRNRSRGANEDVIAFFEVEIHRATISVKNVHGEDNDGDDENDVALRKKMILSESKRVQRFLYDFCVDTSAVCGCVIFVWVRQVCVGVSDLFEFVNSVWFCDLCRGLCNLGLSSIYLIFHNTGGLHYDARGYHLRPTSLGIIFIQPFMASFRPTYHGIIFVQLVMASRSSE